MDRDKLGICPVCHEPVMACCGNCKWCEPHKPDCKQAEPVVYR